MLSFKVMPQTHQTISRWSKRLWIVALLLGIGFLAFTAVQNYLRSNAILKDHTEVTVPVELKEITEEKHRKGRVTNTYHFAYAFEVEGKQYQGEFTTSEDNATPYMEDDAQIVVAYANGNPGLFERLSMLQSQSDAMAVAKRILIALPLAALLALVMHLLVVLRLFVPRETAAA